jgi:hypothetical protein
VPRLAEDAFGRLDPGQQRLARAVMLRLAGEDTGGGAVRRRVPLSELEGTRDDDLATVLGVLTERRLLTTSATSVEVAHEALLREWPRLRGWLREDAEGRRIRRHLAVECPRFRGHLRAFVERRRRGGEKCLGPDRRTHRSFAERRSSSFISRASPSIRSRRILGSRM